MTMRRSLININYSLDKGLQNQSISELKKDYNKDIKRFTYQYIKNDLLNNNYDYMQTIKNKDNLIDNIIDELNNKIVIEKDESGKKIRKYKYYKLKYEYDDIYYDVDDIFYQVYSKIKRQHDTEVKLANNIDNSIAKEEELFNYLLELVKKNTCKNEYELTIKSLNMVNTKELILNKLSYEYRKYYDKCIKRLYQYFKEDINSNKIILKNKNNKVKVPLGTKILLSVKAIKWMFK